MIMEPTAIVGMSCIFAGAANLSAYRDNVFGAVDAFRDAPAGWAPPWGVGRRGADPVTTRGGWLGDLAAFDPLSYGVMPTSIEGSEPEHFVALRLAAEAIRDAGYHERAFDRSATGVVLGRGTFVNRAYVSVLQHTIGIGQTLDALARLHPEWPEEVLIRLDSELRAGLPPFTAETAPGLAHSVMCGRIANRLDLMGPAYAVDAACASSLIAIELAINELESGRAAMMLAGGIQISTSYPIAALFGELGALSRTGVLRPFHPDADGTLLGEGAGVIALKRLSDAQRDGDRVYAVLRGVGSASDGKAMGILAPRVEGEELAMRRAYERSGTDPRDVTLVEAHGTGTPVGDATEIEALGRVWAGADDRSVTIGSVKSMIGHCIPAAGIAGVIKTALALHHRVLPPTLHASAADERFAGTPFRASEKARPWVHAVDRPRRAAVSSFGFGGIDAHAILEECVSSAAPGRTRCGDPTELILVTADDDAGLLLAAKNLVGAAADTEDLTALVAATDLVVEPGRPRAAIVADSAADLGIKAALLVDRLRRGPRQPVNDRRGVYYQPECVLPDSPLAFVFPGEGSQRPGMLEELCREFAPARHWFDLIDTAVGVGVCGTSIFPPDNSGEAARRRLEDLDLAVLSVYAADRAVLAVLEAFGVVPGLVCGHSSGEFAALHAAGALVAHSVDDEVEQLRAATRINRALMAEDLVPGARLLAVGGAAPDAVRRVIEGSAGELQVALDNCPHQIVLCGSEGAVTRASEVLRRQGAVCNALPISRAYHTPSFLPVAKRLAPYYDALPLQAPVIPLWSCVTTTPMPADPAAVRGLAREQWSRPVRFRETVEAMYGAGARVFVEVGPGAIVSGMIRDTLGSRPHATLAVEAPGRSSVPGLHHLLAQLVAHGAAVHLGPLRSSAPEPAPRPMVPLDLRLPVLRVEAPELAPRPASSDSGPLSALTAYAGTMGRLLDTEQQVVTATLARRRHPRRHTRVLRPDPDTVLLVRRFDPDHDDVLFDHTIGPRLSDHSGLRPLAVLPLAVSLELIAEAAAVLGEYAGHVTFRDVTARAWVAFPCGAGLVRVVVHRDAQGLGGALWQVAAGATPTTPAVSARIDFGPPSDTGPVRTTRSGRPGRWAPDELYAPGAWHGMFHGPSLQTVASIDRVADDGAVATLAPAPTSSLASPDLASPRLVDGAGQVLGFWCADLLTDRFVVFPTSVDTISVSGRGAALATCSVAITDRRTDEVVASMSVTGPEVRIEARGWRARRMDLPPEFYAYRIDPRDHYLSEPLAVPLLSRVPVWSARTLLTAEFLNTDGGIWAEVLAHLVLGERERERWRSLPGPRHRRLEWLLGRVAAKDAVRRMYGETTGRRPLPADVEVVTDRLGRPTVVVESTDGRRRFVVSIAHAAGVGVALCTDNEQALGLGVDVEPAAAVPDIETAALTDSEHLDLARVAPDQRAIVVLQAWCAKEAVAKALGTGLAAAGGPMAFEVVDLAHTNGSLLVRADVDRSLHDVSVWSEAEMVLAATVRVSDAPG